MDREKVVRETESGEGEQKREREREREREGKAKKENPKATKKSLSSPRSESPVPMAPRGQSLPSP